jgi:hypothetical protein
MNTRYILALFLIFLNTSASAAAPSDFGAGIMIGSMVSATGKHWFDDQKAVDFGVGFTGSDDVAIYADYLWHIRGVFGSTTRFGRETMGYLGGGAGLGFWDDSYDCGRFGCDRRRDDSGTGIFLRLLIGFEWVPPTTRFGFFAEVGPSFLIVPDVDTDLDIGIGARYYF